MNFFIDGGGYFFVVFRMDMFFCDGSVLVLVDVGFMFIVMRYEG